MKALVDAVTAVTSQPAFSYTSLAVPILPSHPNGMKGRPPLRKRKHDDMPSDCGPVTAGKKGKNNGSTRSKKGNDVDEARARRLEQNRLAAIESRRRKKVMTEELQRSVQFYSKANASLKLQNDELQRQIILAKQKVIAFGENAQSETTEAAASGEDVAKGEIEHTSPNSERCEDSKSRISGNYSYLLTPGATAENPELQQQAQKAQFAAAQALYKSMGFPPTAARAAASTFSHVGQARTIPAMHNDTKSKSSQSDVSSTTVLRNEDTPTEGAASFRQQAQQAQFAATQALYKSMGYPPGAARVAACTLSQFVGQTGMIPGVPEKPVISSEIKSTTVATKSFPGNDSSTSDAKKSLAAEYVDVNPSTSYIEALNQFAMQQAAAANAAAAAATAAIQAVNWHSHFKKNVGPSQAMPSFPFPFVSPAPWQFPIAARTPAQEPSSKKDE